MFLRRLNLEENYKYNVLWIKSQIKYLRFQLKVRDTVYFIRQKIFGQKLFPSNANGSFLERREQVSLRILYRVKSIAVSNKEANGEHVCTRFAIKARLKEALFRVITGETGSS